MPVNALLFDADGLDATVDVRGGVPDVAEHQLLWVDVQVDGSDGDLPGVLGGLGVPEDVRGYLSRVPVQPELHQYERFVVLTLHSVEKGAHAYEVVPVQVLAGQNRVFTVHGAPVTFLRVFREQLEADTKLGRLDSAAFLAVLLNGHVESYFQLLSPLESNLDRLDETILKEPRRNARHLETLVALRRRVGDLRRHLGAHRVVYAGLASPDFVVFQGDEPEAMLERTFRQFERAQEAVGHTREMVLGSFDLLMSSTGQRTNDIVRVLTVATVVLGIVAAVAGIMGMNFEADVFRAGNVGFRDVLLGCLGLIVLVGVVGRWRGWL